MIEYCDIMWDGRNKSYTVFKPDIGHFILSWVRNGSDNLLWYGNCEEI